MGSSNLSSLAPEIQLQLLGMQGLEAREIKSSEEPGAERGEAGEAESDSLDESENEPDSDGLEEEEAEKPQEGAEDFEEEPESFKDDGEEGPFEDLGPPDIVGTIVFWCENCEQQYLSPIATNENPQKAAYIKSIKTVVAECPRCHEEAVQHNSGIVVEPEYAVEESGKVTSSVRKRGLGKRGTLLSEALQYESRGMQKEQRKKAQNEHENALEAELRALAESVEEVFRERYPDYDFQILEIDAIERGLDEVRFVYRYGVTVIPGEQYVQGKNFIVMQIDDRQPFEELLELIACCIVNQIEDEDMSEFSGACI